MAIHKFALNGSRKANNGMSVLAFGAARNDTPLKKYGTEKSMNLDL